MIWKPLDSGSRIHWWKGRKEEESRYWHGRPISHHLKSTYWGTIMISGVWVVGIARYWGVHVTGLVIMEVCAALVHWDNGGSLALYIDPALAVTSAALLIWLSYPYGRPVFFNLKRECILYDGVYPLKEVLHGGIAGFIFKSRGNSMRWVDYGRWYDGD